jgi:hypothetical protein
MNYVILNYADDGSLTHSAIIFGKNNLKLVDTKQIFNLYKFTDGDNEFYFPIKKSNERLKLEQSQIIFTEYPFLNNCKKIVSLPSLKDENLVNAYKNEILIQILFLGDPATVSYEHPVKVITSVNPENSNGTDLFFDIKLCIPFFFYKNQLSLIDFIKADTFKTKTPKDKVFFYARRADERMYGMRDRGYFINMIKTKLNTDLFEISNSMHKNVELSRVQYGLYHLGNFFDYNDCMFNLVFESQHVDYFHKNQFWISEKTLFPLLLSNPFFLFASKPILNALKELNIKLLNDEFEFDDEDIEKKFEAFIQFINNSNFESKKEFYVKMNEKQMENRKKVLEYIYSPKKEVIEFLIN